MRPIVAEVAGRCVLARELAAQDLDALVAYWHETPPDYLRSLGVDVAKIGTPRDTRARLSSGLARGRERTAITVVAEVDGRVVAYTNVRAIDAQTACAHMHTLVRDETVTALVYELFAPVSAAVLQTLGRSRLRFEASTGNRGINRYLESFGLQPRTVLLDEPDGLARVGAFNVYELDTAPVATPAEKA